MPRGTDPWSASWEPVELDHVDDIPFELDPAVDKDEWGQAPGEREERALDRQWDRH